MLFKNQKPIARRHRHDLDKKVNWSIKLLNIKNFTLHFFLWILLIIPVFSQQEINLVDVLPEIEGIPRSGENEIYTPDNLFEYINGAAELYLSYDFQELDVIYYDNSKEQSLTLEIYRFNNDYNAFGMYSQERPEEGKFLHLGAQGYYASNILNFVQGNYYIKINSYNLSDNEETILVLAAKKVSEQLIGENNFPTIIDCFPEKGKFENSEKYISRNFLGYSFLNSAFTARYHLSDNIFKIFILEGKSSVDCREMLEKYLEETESRKDITGEGKYVIQDSYHGQISLFWRGKYIWGVIGLQEQQMITEYLSQIEKKL